MYFPRPELRKRIADAAVSKRIMSVVKEKDFPDPQPQGITARMPTVHDSAAIWQLVKESGVLELNSAYSYLILCQHFGNTCIIAEHEGKVVGFVTAYRPPVKPDVIFVWQIGVAALMRGQGLGLFLLQSLVRQDGCRGVSFLEATVTPSNGASQALFRALARRLDTNCVDSPCFTEELFPEGGHEPEYLFRIGPIPTLNGS